MHVSHFFMNDITAPNVSIAYYGNTALRSVLRSENEKIFCDF